ncbi:MAG: lipid A biosynthesis acyltransferase [Deltaproteobacteria bacterium]|nr:lipid A biosynthesis acyltransferase [Deltaproteobacteria bacterium]
MARIPLRKRLRRAMRYLALRVAGALLACFPLRAALALGRLAGDAAFLLAAGERRRSLEHLARALPELPAGERRVIARECFRSLGESAAELSQLGRIDPLLSSYVELSPGDEATLRSVLKGQGAVAITGHIGSWELLFRRFVRGGFDAYAVGKENPDPRLTAWIDRLRGPGRTIWRAAEGGARQLLRTFRANAILALLIDQDTRVQGHFVPFFGELAFTPRAAADLALRMGAGVVAVFIHRRPEGGHRIAVRTISFEPTGDREADSLALTAAMTREIEGEIRRFPRDWVWMHRRWKTRPSGG